MVATKARALQPVAQQDEARAGVWRLIAVVAARGELGVTAAPPAGAELGVQVSPARVAVWLAAAVRAFPESEPVALLVEEPVSAGAVE
ncbi:MAG TPA: hypothetical protein VHY84_12880 [Bryobacteraceae bacterium]|jgi:hypothetical protein|nr:hypothetical protein [Bryobacteraceae bacterium]